jgi:hypothetical protein
MDDQFSPLKMQRFLIFCFHENGPDSILTGTAVPVVQYPVVLSTVDLRPKEECRHSRSG